MYTGNLVCCLDVLWFLLPVDLPFMSTTMMSVDRSALLECGENPEAFLCPFSLFPEGQYEAKAHPNCLSREDVPLSQTYLERHLFSLSFWFPLPASESPALLLSTFSLDERWNAARLVWARGGEVVGFRNAHKPSLFLWGKATPSRAAAHFSFSHAIKAARRSSQNPKNKQNKNQRWAIVCNGHSSVIRKSSHHELWRGATATERVGALSL